MNELVFPEGVVDEQLPSLFDLQLRRSRNPFKDAGDLAEDPSCRALPRREDRENPPPSVA